ncbi:MAG TPA: response regulator, partial [Terriglobia bacterium]|nr:response regulator [Terriglobia bacterium]
MTHVKPRILIVEDDPDTRSVMLRILQSGGYKTFEAENAETGLESLAKNKIDILITDLHLPGMDGIELLKRAKQAAPEIEVVLVTAHGTVEVAVEALRDGAYDFIPKPVR